MILEDGFTQFHQAYGSVDGYRRQPLFVTTDAAYHYWHLVFAKALKDTEQSVLLPVLEGFSERLLELATAQEIALAASEIAANATAVRAYGQVLTALAGLPTGPYPASVMEELALVRDHLESASRRHRVHSWTTHCSNRGVTTPRTPTSPGTSSQCLPSAVPPSASTIPTNS